MNSASARPAAVYLDRDGTLIEDRHYPADPEQVALVPGAAEAVRLLNEAGVLAIVVTNQSGIAQGKVTPANYESVKARLDELLAAEGARVDATYFCPHHPDFTGPCRCRKPGLELYERAARDLGFDPAQALFIGDRLRDVLPALALGGRGVLVPSEATPHADLTRALEEFAVDGSLLDVVREALALPVVGP